MSTPISAASQQFFSQRTESEDSLRQAFDNLPPPPAMPSMRSRRASAPVTSFQLSGGFVNNALSFFSRPHALVGDVKPTKNESRGSSEADASDDATLLEARMFAVLVQAHGKCILEQLSSHRKGLALVAAARLGYLEAVRQLLKTDTDLGIFDGLGENAMMAAARTGQLKVLARLLKAGCSVEYCSPSGQSGDAIAYALQYGQAHSAAMMALHHNIRVSQIVAGHPLRACKGESPISILEDDEG